ncbi:HD-GYP domain-containing protein [Tumebacillus flagellatus]|uniref:Uncharacterized protein n=1 Tax=Tumebacillus flagellatus TaxID=1157490 RepID=A0A074LY34_9BACL|nr:HD-GYP domain-containing protein [Tumebacillus flagellatus]KEO85038.1 hypothetical protein EL26_00280 [Tumebacillus flagellatus]
MKFESVFTMWRLMVLLSGLVTGLYQILFHDFPFFWYAESMFVVTFALMLILPERFPRAAVSVLFWSQVLLTLGVFDLVHADAICAAMLFFVPIYTMLYANRTSIILGELLILAGYLAVTRDEPLRQHLIFLIIFTLFSILLHFVSQILVRKASEAAKFQERVEVFSRAIEARDAYTQGHSRRVARYAVAIGKHMPGIDIDLLRVAGELHDIGKISTPDAVLHKPGRLTDEEYDVIKRHPVDGANLLRRFEVDGPILDGVLYHHERMNGTGYPEGRFGENIPMVARILAVADTFDAMTTTRSYRKAFPPQTAYDEILTLSGVYYDPQVVECFVRGYEDILAILQQEEDERPVLESVM